MIKKLLCFLGFHYFKVVHVDLTFSSTEKIETSECINCKRLKIKRKKLNK
ncbi:MAG: hypothetical protein VW204_04365 [Pelagibacteraceae bacterium]